MKTSEELKLALNEAMLEKTKDVSVYQIIPKNNRNYLCKIEGCCRPAYAKNMCNAHYIRHRKKVDMNIPVKARKRDDKCELCGEETGAKGGWGLCVKHYKFARSSLIKDTLILAMGGRCEKCNGIFHRNVFDFHHIGSKEESPSSLIASKSIEKIADEVSKCILLCANCHRMEHINE